MTAEEIFRKADAMACEMVKASEHPSCQPFLIVLERREFEEMMMSDSAPRYVHFDHDKEFPFPSSGWRICGLPIRRVPDGDWVGKLIEPYPLVMSQLQAQMNFGGEYG